MSRSTDPRTHARLRALLEEVVPDAQLTPTPIPHCAGMELLLVTQEARENRYGIERVQAILENPPYWCLCWPSGLVLARHLLEHPEWTAGKSVLDVGTGSGVVAIAAKLAGARKAIACDTDPAAREAAAANARLNGVQIEITDRLGDRWTDQLDLVVAADVLYDRENLDLLDRLALLATRVLVADCRLHDLGPSRFVKVAEHASHLWPDLDASAEFRRVSLFEARRGTPVPDSGWKSPATLS